ncbi:MAG: GIY-YIG nuclease family protein [Parvibaculales bacterium]
MTTKPPISGAECIAEKSRNIGTASGVYRMLDKNGDVIYIGKAKNLKNRIKNYTRLEGHPKRIARMIYATHDMEFITTDDENEALLLEASLIKKLRPPYNILLRDDKSFPYILIAHDHEAPQT